ncbi:MAG TPA: hypothetical protein V6C71_26675 [Coleofasciculaceae cyanobacterium]
MNICICCHDHLLRHINHHRVYWFCPSCHQEMPNIEELNFDGLNLTSKLKIAKLKLKKSELISNIQSIKHLIN